MALRLIGRIQPDIVNCTRHLAGHAKWQNVAKAKKAYEEKQQLIKNKWLPRLRNEAKNGSDLSKNASLRKLYNQAISEGLHGGQADAAIKCWENADFKECEFGVQGPAGVFGMICCASTSPNKTQNDLISYSRRYGFKLSNVGFQFCRVKDVTCELPEGAGEEEVEELALQCGTEEYSVEGNTITFTIPEEEQKGFFEEVKALGLVICSQEARWEAREMIEVKDGDTWKRIALFMEMMETNLEGYERIYHNIENIDEILSGKYR